MKFTLPLLMVSAAGFLTAADIDVNQTGLIVHEWGTFTSVAGEDGSAMEWSTLDGKDDLPKFVQVFRLGFKIGLRGTVRMETPVLFFYSPSHVKAHVRVTFPNGLMTEWYPQARYGIYQKGQDGEMRQLPPNLDGMDTSMRSQTGTIEWTEVQVEPGAAPKLPVENAPSRYYAARATNAAPLAVGEQHEKFLFYRGVAQIPVPLSVRLERDGRIAVQNVASVPVPVAILFENRGGRVGFREAGAIADSVMVDRPALDGSSAALRSRLESALVGQGLYPAEAQAMLSTWQDSWFEEGSRLIYILSSSTVDGMLPLQVDPAPAQTARVFVGRIEIVTPETEASVEQAIRNGDGSVLDRYGRFLDPILTRISAESAAKAAMIDQFRTEVLPQLTSRRCQ